MLNFPNPAQGAIGYARFMAQCGKKHRDAKALQGFGGAGVIEIVTDFSGDAFRAVYTLRLAEAVLVLHAFQKKAKSSVATPQQDLDLIRKRLREAEGIAREMQG